MSQHMLILRGPQGSGKSTFAKKWVDVNPYERARVNRDDIRFSTYNSYVIPFDLENSISKIEEASIVSFISQNKSVVIDNVNVKAKYVLRYLELAKKLNVPVIYKDFYVDLDTALERNSKRDRQVDEDVIKKTFSRFVQNGKLPAFPELKDFSSEKYVPVLDADKAYIVDLDGTVALLGDRSPYDYSDKVLNDEPNIPVIDIIRLVSDNGAKILITSGRDGVCYDDTVTWLDFHGVPHDEVFMRPEGSFEKDFVVKKRIFDEKIRDNYNVVGVFDDRLQVCELWYDLGLPLFRVGNPNAVF